MKPIWIVDDDQSIRWVLEKALARENFATRSFANVREASAALDHDSPQVLVSDIRMPGGSGLELLQTVRDKVPGLPVIIMTAFSDLDSAVAAFQGGAFEYLAKPFDVDKAVELIRRAVDESMRGEQTWDDRVAEAPEMLGQAPAMQDMFRAIGRLSHSAATVLITGESGTGKELVARALHRHSPRANGPFIALNTAAIPKDLLESELFGHERGAFTGAQAMRQGRFEQAENGTLFLDEIGDMPFDLQTRLLRVLSDGQFYRVGGHNPLRANVRVIAATHQNLESRVRQGLFREDLYHRLNVIRLRLPALRERNEDIPLLTRHFLQKSARDLGVEPKRVSEEALAYLASLPFPGNVRQLENLANWLTVMAPAQTIETKDLPPDLGPAHGSGSELGAGAAAGATTDGTVATNAGIAGGVPLAGTNGGALVHPGGAAGASVATALSAWEGGLRTEVARMLRENAADVMDELARRFEAAVIREALDFTRGRKVEAAERLGIGRNTITRKIQELNLEP
ncbi:two-component system nitrogen regulation response regulator GlnG [Paraburkholderia sp. HC6.4b]|uniref:nitrogen regulation protein NR(I) n=1 Tax=unclassified Paraburkholderia TaxID=2615204 RepID=UPI001614BC6B|nr:MULTISPECIES: nitrogen regulation protein NR(I) [unclassified Paraburkholderia]MBB5411639.1 two-component system nitrogen regulation response regulator GlnG [Paraburkholderia sp. HC6.4b]MBB5453332.1 two-component system nitrogen regulation response regulator GlnG [Paraburkholderia sp. Kb1A]